MESTSQVYVPPSVVRKGANWSMVSVELLITNTLDEASVLVMVTTGPAALQLIGAI